MTADTIVQPLISLALVLVLVGLGVLVASPFLARQLLFMPPSTSPGPPPTLAGVQGQEIRLETEDEVEVHGWWYPAPPRPDGTPAPAVLALHGNAGSIAGRTMLVRGLLERGIGVLALSYRGYGHSEGRPELEGIARDVRAGLRFLADEAGGEHRVVIHGRSLGGAAALSALDADAPVPAGVVLESSFTSLVEIARTVYPIPGPLLRRLEGTLDARSALRTYTGPVLVIHGSADRVVPVRMSETLHAEAADSRGLWIVDGAGHNDLEQVAGPEHARRIADFVDEVTGAASSGG